MFECILEIICITTLWVKFVFGKAGNVTHLLIQKKIPITIFCVNVCVHDRVIKMNRHTFGMYVIASSVYGCTRKIAQVANAKVDARDNISNRGLDKKVPMLLVDKTIVVAFSTLAAWPLFPLHMYNDMVWIETVLRKQNLDDYYTPILYKKSIVSDYLFS